MKLQIDTSLYRRNKHIAYWSFILCRPVLMPFFWYATYEHLKSGIFWEIEKPTQFVWLIFGGLLDALNLIWTRSLTIGITYYFLIFQLSWLILSVSPFFKFEQYNYFQNIKIGLPNPKTKPIGKRSTPKTVNWDEYIITLKFFKYLWRDKLLFI